MKKTTEILMKIPMFIGKIILHVSKTLMYEFHCDYMLLKMWKRIFNYCI